MKKALTGLMLLLSLVARGQVDGVYYPPNVIPPSPDVATLFKVQDVPVDTKNGTANVSIPIYTVKDGRIEVPISISYNTVGIKVQQISGMIGLGWDFEFGGAITRQSEDINMGENRVQFTTDTTATQIQADENYTLAYQLADGLAEKTQPEYFYHFGKYSGSFFYDVNGKLFVKSDNPNLNIQLLNYGDTDAAYHDDYVSGFLVTTDEGIQYTFASPEFTSGVAAHVSDFLITQIFDPNTHKTVQFRYASAPTFIDNLNQANMENYCVGGPNQTCGPECIITGGEVPWAMWNYYSQSYNQITHYTLQIDSIIFSNGLVTFQADTNRSDGNHILINKINVYNLAGASIRTAQFYQSYFVDTTSTSGYPYVPTPDTAYKYRLRLDSLGFFDNTNTKVERYNFTYNQTRMLPAYKYNVPLQSGGSNYTSCTAVDYFGFFNGQLANQGLVPDSAISSYDRENYTIVSTYEGNRAVDTVCAQAGVLTKVKFPTRGSVVFTYESNRFDYAGGNTGNLGQFLGGLRIKSLAYYDNDSSSTAAITKNFTYSGAVMADMPPVSTFYHYDKVKNFTMPSGEEGDYCTAEGTESSTFRLVNSSPIGSMAYLDMQPTYQQVAEYTVSGSTSLGKTVFYNSTEQQIDDAGAPYPEYGDWYAVDKGWIKSGLLDSVGYYNQDNEGNYHLIKGEGYTYTDFNHVNPTIGVLSERDDYENDYYPQDPGPFCYFTSASILTSWYAFFTAFNTYGIRRMTQKRVTDYTDSGNQVITYNYTYDSLHYYLRQTQTTDSKGSTLLDILKYPQDSSTFDNLSGTALTAMDSLAERNMLSTVIEKQHYNNSILMSRTRTNYGVFNVSNSVIMPQIIQTQKLTNNLDNRLEYNSYDTYGNVLSVSKDHDENICYLWGYNNLYPIAKVVNSATSDIAYTSFEDNAEYSGNWFITATSRVVGDGVTGNQCFSVGGGSTVESPTINSATVYVASYWIKSTTPFTISGTEAGYPIQGATINGWTYFEHLVTGVTSFSLSGTGYIDELRLYPQTAQMTTYAYTPLIGKIAECDVSNKITYFQYDAYNRLELILDQYYNIVKAYCYNYAGEASTCNGTINVGSQYNISYESWTIQLTDISTGNVYNFTLPSYVGSYTALGTVPSGMYNVQINEVGSSGSHNIYFGSYYESGSSMSLSNIPISSTIYINLPD